jgi:hypothetical protein
MKSAELEDASELLHKIDLRELRADLEELMRYHTVCYLRV